MTLRLVLWCLMVMGAWVPAMAQRNLEITECLILAVENNLQIQQSKNQLSISEVALLQQKLAFVPGVQGGANVSKSFGTFVDNFTQQIAESPITGSPSLSATLAIFEGMAKWHNLKKAKYDLSAAQYGLEDLKNDIRLTVATTFFQTIFAADQVTVAQERVELVNKQLEKVMAQAATGLKTDGEVVAARAQLSTEKSALVQQNNSYRKSLLSLIQAMNLPTDSAYAVKRPPLVDVEEIDTLLPSIDAIYQGAVLFNPGLRAKAMEALSQKYSLKSSKTVLMPKLSLAYGLGSFYSSNNRPILRLETGPGGGLIPIYGNPVPLFEQLGENFGQNLSLGLTVPIFSSYSMRGAVNSARVSYENALLSEESEERELYKAIQQAYLDAEAALALLRANQDQMENVKLALDYAQAKFDAGVLDFYGLMDFVNNHSKAQASLLQSQYDCLLKLKILDLYQGKPLTF